MNNLVGNDLKMLETNFKIGVIKEEQFQNGLEIVVENFLKDTGIDVDLIYSDSKNMPKDSKNSEGTARIEDGKIKIYINTKAIESTSQLIGTVFEEVAHVLDGVAGRQQETTEEEKKYGEYGLESLGKPTGKYFEDMYKENDRPITLSGDGIDYSDVEGEKLGDKTKDVTKDKNIYNGVGRIETIQQLKFSKSYSNLRGKDLEEAIRKDYGLTELEFADLLKDYIDREKYDLEDLGRIYVEIAIGYLAGKNKFLGIIGTVFTAEAAVMPTVKFFQGYGSNERAAFRMALSFEIVLNQAADSINKYEVNFVNNLYKSVGIQKLPVYMGENKLPNNLEKALKKGIQIYNNKENVIPITYEGVFDMIQRDYYYRRTNQDSRVYIERNGGTKNWKRVW